MGFFDDVGGFFTNTLGGVFGGVKDFASDVFNTGKNVVNDVWGEVKSIIHAPTELVAQVVDRGADVVKSVGVDIKDTVTGAAKEAGGAISNLGSSFSWPLAAAAGIVGLAFVLKSK